MTIFGPKEKNEWDHGGEEKQEFFVELLGGLLFEFYFYIYSAKHDKLRLS